MRTLGLALALTLALALPAAAQQAQGRVYSINTADDSIVLDDGTKLWVSKGEITDLSLGSEVQASYETRGDKKFVTGMARPNLEGNFDRLQSIQADGE
jgi:hypothetical protein